MMRAIALPLAMLLAHAPLGAQDAEIAQGAGGDPVIAFETVDVQMNAAIEEARANTQRWLAVLGNPPVGTQNIMFKFPLEGHEHIWVGEVAREGDHVTGRLMNNPHAQGWSLGDRVRVPIADISDWGYVDPVGKAHGFYTVRVMVDHMEPGEAAEVRRQYGWSD